MKTVPFFSNKYLFLFLILILIFACRDSAKSKELTPEQDVSIPERVAQAHGYEHWPNIREIAFTFNVERDTLHFERHWFWQPNKGMVVAISGKDTVSYNKTLVDSSLTAIDAAFINDKFWLLAPFNLIWDRENFDFSFEPVTKAPISGEAMQKLTVVYNSEGGYTPGDAYDFYFGDDYLIKEWVFRKSNQSAPSLATTWEAYKDFKGIKLATEYRRADPKYRLYFTNINIR